MKHIDWDNVIAYACLGTLAVVAAFAAFVS